MAAHRPGLIPGPQKITPGKAERRPAAPVPRHRDPRERTGRVSGPADGTDPRQRQPSPEVSSTTRCCCCCRRADGSGQGGTVTPERDHLPPIGKKTPELGHRRAGFCEEAANGQAQNRQRAGAAGDQITLGHPARSAASARDPMLNRKSVGQRAGGSTRRSVSGAGFLGAGVAGGGLSQLASWRVTFLPDSRSSSAMR